MRYVLYLCFSFTSHSVFFLALNNAFFKERGSTELRKTWTFRPEWDWLVICFIRFHCRSIAIVWLFYTVNMNDGDTHVLRNTHSTYRGPDAFRRLTLTQITWLARGAFCWGCFINWEPIFAKMGTRRWKDWGVSVPYSSGSSRLIPADSKGMKEMGGGGGGRGRGKKIRWTELDVRR